MIVLFIARSATRIRARLATFALRLGLDGRSNATDTILTLQTSSRCMSNFARVISRRSDHGDLAIAGSPAEQGCNMPALSMIESQSERSASMSRQWFHHASDAIESEGVERRQYHGYRTLQGAGCDTMSHQPSSQP